MAKIYKTLEELLTEYPEVPLGQAADLRGKTYTRLTPICRVFDKSTTAYWACQCECGNYARIRGGHMLQSRIKSCGCLQQESMKMCHRKHYSPNHADLLGQQFNYLTPIRYLGRGSGNHAMWECQCECGNVITVSATHLKTGHTTSCGCSKTSQYERRVERWLLEHKFQYKRETRLLELERLRFDFQVFHDDTYTLIEIQGQQHYRPNDLFGGQSAFEILQKHDQEKVEYCKAHNISLLIIRYDEDIEQILADTFLP